MSGSLSEWLEEAFLTVAEAGVRAAQNQEQGGIPGGIDVSWLPGIRPTTYEANVPSWSSDDPVGYTDVKRGVASLLPDVPSEVITSYLRTWGQERYDANKVWPSFMDALNDDYLLIDIQRSGINANVFPPFYAVREADGTYSYYSNTSAGGIRPVERRPQPRGVSTSLKNSRAGEPDESLRHRNAPVFSRAFVDSIIQDISSGGGGGGRAPLVLDKAAIAESITGLWRTLLLEEPPNADALASQYHNAASSFYNTGGQLDLDTWTRQKIRDTARYGNLYRRKPSELTEEQYMGRYMQNAAQFGVSDRVTKREVEAGATSGASVSGFVERVGRTREVSQQPGFAQRFGNVLGNMGSLARS